LLKQFAATRGVPVGRFKQHGKRDTEIARPPNKLFGQGKRRVGYDRNAQFCWGGQKVYARLAVASVVQVSRIDLRAIFLFKDFADCSITARRLPPNRRKLPRLNQKFS
jgi:hypothetical protein